MSSKEGTYQIPGDIFVTKIKQTKERNERQTKKGEYAYAGTDKKASSIQLPIIKDKRVELRLETQERAQTSVVSIQRVIYNQGYIFVTIQTKNSIYQDIPIPVIPSSNFYDGQTIQRGASVSSSFGTSLVVGDITQVTPDGIRILDSKGNEYFGDIKANS